MDCLVCGNPGMTTYLDLGDQPLANTYPEKPTELPTYPLSVQYCNRCWHSQLAKTVDPDLLFRDYAYVSGTSRTLDAYFEWFVQKVEADFPEQRLRVLDIAGNDGSLALAFMRRGHDVLNMDPAQNLAKVSASRGVDTVCNYWPVVDGPYEWLSNWDVIVAMNVLAHVGNPLEFLVACRETLAPDGRVYVQTSQADMLQTGEFDAIYHEHVSYFSPSSFITLAGKAALGVQSFEEVPIHGTSHLWTLSEKPSDVTVDGFANDPRTYEDFGVKSRERARFVKDLFDRHDGPVVGFGAAAKTNTFLNFSGAHLDWIVDENPLKIGRFTPGGNIPIYGPQSLLVDEPLLIVVTAWNFYDEIRSKVKAIRDNPADLFCRYFPAVEICH